jgi:hypothetical protein
MSYILIAATVALLLVCFVFILFFSVTLLSAATQLSFVQFAVLLSFCTVFCIAGNSFLTVAGLLYDKVRR